MSSIHEQIVKANETFAASFDEARRNVPIVPARKMMVITCMDGRLQPEEFLGLKPGEALVVRSAGGRAIDALRSVVMSQILVGIKEFVVIHHTDCGMLRLKEHEIREKLKANPPKPNITHIAASVDQVAFMPFSDVDQSIIDDVVFLKGHPLVTEDAVITGYRYDVNDGKIERVV